MSLTQLKAGTGIAGACGVLGGIGEQPDFYTAILFAAFRGIVGSHFLVLADADEIETAGRNVVFRRKVLHHRIGAALAEIVVVIGRADGVGSAGHFENEALRRAKLLAEVVELFLVILGQNGLIEAERDGDIPHRTVVIQSLNYAVERIRAMNGISCTGPS